MRRNTVLLATFSLLVIGLTGSRLSAQEHTDMTHKKSSPAKAAAAAAPTIFCPTMNTGQLCSHGTADALKLSGEKRESWVAAARRYNKAVAAATKQLQEDVKTSLKPEELALVEMWFAEGLNPEINRILATKQ